MKIRMRITALVCAWLILLTSLISLAGYMTGHAILKQPPDDCSLKVNAVICLFLLSLALFAGNACGQERMCRIVYYSSSVLVVLISGLTIFEHWTGIEMHIHNLPGFNIQEDSLCPLRMSPIASACFLLIGLCFFFSYGRMSGNNELFRLVLSGLVFFTSLFISLAYIFNVDIAIGYNYSGMSLYTALSLIVVSVGFLASHKELRVMRMMTGKTTGGTIARGLVLLLLVLLPLLSYLRVLGERVHSYHVGFGTSLVTVFLLTIFTVTILAIALFIDRKEEELRKSEEHFKSLVQNASEYAIYMLDPEGHVISWNKGAAKMKGYTEEEIIGKHFSLFYTEEENADGEPNYNLKKAIELGNYKKEEWRKKKDGARFLADISITPVFTAEGQLKGFIEVTRDITERKKAEEEKIMRLIAEKKNEELENFAYILTHDLKAPLRNIVTLSNWITEENEQALSKEGREYLQLMKDKSEQLVNLVDEVLTYIRTDKSIVERKKVNCHSLVEEIIGTLVISTNIHIKIDNALPVLNVSPVSMKQVFTNLLDNAIKHNDKEKIEIHVGCKEEEKRWVFYVKDNGPGISKEFHQRIFLLFQSLKPKRDKKSTGVGLATVKKSVEKEGGEIWLDSDLGKGATFFFTIRK
jgi:PAS domain S-box-containing protein